MSDSPKKTLTKQGSLSYIEQSLRMISPPQQAPVTIYPGPRAGLQNLSKADIEIANRLEKLRKKDNVPSEEEMAARLAQLKGLPHDYYTKPTVITHLSDKRTQVEQADDLIKQALGEVSLESKIVKPEDEIEERLAKLRGSTDVAHQSTNVQSPSEDRSISSISTDANDLDFQEFENAMQNSEKEALQAIASISEDKDISAAIVSAKKKLKKDKARKSKRRSSDEEYFSGSDVELSSKSSDNKEAQKEKEEVDRIVQMYVEKAKLKKEKKKKKKLARAKGEVVSSSESELTSSESDIVTSESEKISDSDQ